MKRVVLALAGICLVAALAGCPPKGGTLKEVKIGCILPLTGDAAVYGKAIKNGMELARAEKETKRPKIEVIYEDDQASAKTGITAFNKLTSVDGVKVVIGGGMSSVCAAIAPVAQSKKVVLLSPTATAPSLSKTGNYFFRIWPSDNYDGQVMADYAYNQMKLRKVCILYVNLEYGKGIAEVFQRDFEKLGGRVLASEGYAQGATDFRAQLAKLNDLKPEAIYLPGYYKEMAAILKQAREMGIQAKWLSVNSFKDPKLLQIAGPAAEGAIFTFPVYDPKSGDALTKQFVTAYKRKYGEEPDIFAVQGYDAFNVLASALKSTDGSPDAVEKALHATKNFKGVGGTMSFDEHGDVTKALRLMTVSRGTFIDWRQ